jgi:hypothetical protein
MAPRLNAKAAAINPLGDKYPDDDTTKPIVLQAEGLETATIGDRHVLLRWMNFADDNAGIYASQVLQLTGGPGSYAFNHPSVKLQSKNSFIMNKFYTLGNFTRAQRNRIVDIARSLDFDMKTRVNSCRTWTRMLLVRMIAEGLLAQEVFEVIDREVPLREPLPEI